jgi:hypothetical protein
MKKMMLNLKRKAKGVALICVILIGITTASAVNLQTPCDSTAIGYYDDYTPAGTAPDPNGFYRISGTYLYNYSCYTNDASFCRYVYVDNIWYYCPGLRATIRN